MPRRNSIVVSLLVVLAGTGGALVGCESFSRKGGKRSAAEGRTRISLDEDHFILSPTRIGNLEVWPIASESTREVGRFISLKEARDKGLAEIRERGAGAAQVALRENDEGGAGEVATGSPPDGAQIASRRDTSRSQGLDVGQPFGIQFDESSSVAPADGELAAQIARASGSATVSSVEIENRSDCAILICAGTLIRGGQQDRQIGKDIVIAPHTTVPVDAFCVEQGRWTTNRAGVETAGKFEPVQMLAVKAVRDSAQYSIDQGAVWENVALANEVCNTTNATSTLLAAVDDFRQQPGEHGTEVISQLEERFETLRESGIAPAGFAYAIDGRLMGARVFAHPRLLDLNLPSFVQTMALESSIAGLRDPQAEASDISLTAEDVARALRAIESQPEEVVSTPAANRNGLRKTQDGGSVTCYFTPAGAARPVPITQEWTIFEK